MKQPLLKFCGNHSLNDLALSIQSKAHFIGIVFAKESRRSVIVSEAEVWFRKIGLRAYQKLVAVFVNSPAAVIQDAAMRLPIDVIQCHGNETVDEIVDLKLQVKKPIWKAIHQDQHTVFKMRKYEGVVDGFIIDTKTVQWGGSGISFDWKHIPLYMEEAKRQGVHCFIAGGIGPDNIDHLLAYEPDGIDIASGIETELKKDPVKIRQIERKAGVIYETT
ncbi:phosphoribosylanthranilate isomerase [Scopulibacillus daqui]|uniref:N-(5'-phosphoribosyl)anthranilate isomerase n=1 Tax=Scopulibacillus daqui TaxID=1469162 RepID=A0ABS2PZ07_9BACL|nr:phosphoribosylanthranilate isomerase [Scopulibacillus daqui]MBM7645286.1 phosphoribosylanthranilate isomerase [Scopulibacillus daqui]